MNHNIAFAPLDTYRFTATCSTCNRTLVGYNPKELTQRLHKAVHINLSSRQMRTIIATLERWII
jgi:hypothetical protein